MIKKYNQYLNESIKKYYDVNGKIVKVGDLVEIQYCSGRYGQTTKVQGIITKMNGGVTLDDELYLSNPFNYDHNSGNYIGYNKHDDYEHGHETYVKKITKKELNPKFAIKKELYTYTVRLIDYSNGKNKDKQYFNQHPTVYEVVDTRKNAKEKFENWMKQNYPNVDLDKHRLIPFSDYQKKYREKGKDIGGFPRINVIITPMGKESHIVEYGIVDI